MCAIALVQTAVEIKILKIEHVYSNSPLMCLCGQPIEETCSTLLAKKTFPRLSKTYAPYAKVREATLSGLGRGKMLLVNATEIELQGLDIFQKERNSVKGHAFGLPVPRQ